jgi:hypothetical protein
MGAILVSMIFHVLFQGDSPLRSPTAPSTTKQSNQVAVAVITTLSLSKFSSWLGIARAQAYYDSRMMGARKIWYRKTFSIENGHGVPSIYPSHWCRVPPLLPAWEFRGEGQQQSPTKARQTGVDRESPATFTTTFMSTESRRMKFVHANCSVAAAGWYLPPARTRPE